MSVSLCFVFILAIPGYARLTLAEKRIESNPQGSFSMGFTDGYINNGDYKVIVPKGSDEIKREVMIRGPGIEDSVDMVFNSNTMVYSNWDGWFKLGDVVYTDEPGTLYFKRSDGKCEKKIYKKQNEEIRVIERDTVDVSTCQALKAKVDKKMNHYLEFPFKYMLPKPDLKLQTSKGFPGGDYRTGIVSGNAYAGQFTVEIPAGDSDKDKEVVITAPGVSATVTMKVNAYSQIYGKWDGSFYIGDKVYTNEPGVLYVDDTRGGCLKKVFENHGTTITVAYEKILQGDECFMIKSKVYNDMQRLIADPKLLADDDKPKPPPQNSAPITVTSTMVFPKNDQVDPRSTISGTQQSSHTITVSPGISGSNTPENVPSNIQEYSSNNVQQNLATNLSPLALQQPLTSSVSGLSSNVHISTVNSAHPGYPSVTATSVMQSPNSQQKIPAVNQPQAVVVNLRQPQMPPEGITILKPNSGSPNQQVVIDQAGNVRLVVPPGVNIPENTLILQPSNDPASTQPNYTPSGDLSSQGVNVNSHNVNIQSDGSFKVDSKSVVLQGLTPITELVTPDGNVIRVARSAGEGVHQQGNSETYHTVTFTNQGNSMPVMTLSGNSQAPSGNVQAVLTLPSNQASPQVQHTTVMHVPGNLEITDNQSPIAVNTNVVYKNEQQQPATKFYYIRSQPAKSNNNLEPASTSSDSLILKMVQPTPPVPRIVTLQTQTSTQNTQNPNNQNQIGTNNPKQITVFSTASQGTAIPLTKPLVLTLQKPSGTQENQIPSNVHLNIGSSGSSILINSQDGKQQVVSSITNPPPKIKINTESKENEKSVFKIMRDLNLPSPVNNLIVNIAENTNFNKKKK